MAIPSAYLPSNYADVDGTMTLRSAYNYDAYLTTGSRTSDFKFISSYNDGTLPATQMSRKSSLGDDLFGPCDEKETSEVMLTYLLILIFNYFTWLCERTSGWKWLSCQTLSSLLVGMPSVFDTRDIAVPLR